MFILMLNIKSKKALLWDNALPDSSYHVMKMMEEIGLGYEKIDACKNDFILFRGLFLMEYKGRMSMPRMP